MQMKMHGGFLKSHYSLVVCILLNTNHVNFDIDVVLECERRNRGPFILKLFIFIQQHGDGEIPIFCVESDCPAGWRMLKGSLKRA